tara:strand:- start:1754 stop:2155 length:402 start_codon:yes stop_codon:yes gene_type:complete
MKNKNSDYITIGQLAKKLNLIDEKTGKPQTHTIRFWESQFKQIKPSVRTGKRRYYSENDFEIIKKIKKLLKDYGMTIKGAKMLLDKDKTNLDVNAAFDVDSEAFKGNIKERIKNLKNLITDLRNIKNGKKKLN